MTGAAVDVVVTVEEGIADWAAVGEIGWLELTTVSAMRTEVGASSDRRKA